MDPGAHRVAGRIIEKNRGLVPHRNKVPPETAI